MSLSALIPGWEKLGLDAFAAKLAELPKAVRDDITKAAYDLTGNMKWVSNAGAQTQAYFCPADILLWGGSGGAGKTDLLCGLAMTAHQQSLFMRQQYNDLDALTERCIKINGTRQGFNGSNPPSLRTTDGRFIQFTGAKTEGWQGAAFDLKCVGAGTLVWMADGSRRPIEAISAGDQVQTIEGPRRVLRAYRMGQKEAGLAVGRDFSGRIVGAQIQSLGHEILTTEGWASHDNICASHRFEICEPMESRFSRRFSSPFALTSEALSRCLCSRSEDLGPFAEPQLWLPGHQFLSEICASGGQPIPGICFEASSRVFRDAQRHRGSSEWQEHQQPEILSGVRPSMRPQVAGNGDYGGRSSSAPQYCWDDYSFGSRRYDGRAPRSSRPYFAAAVGLFCLPPQGDAARPSPNDFEDDGPGKIQTHTLHRGMYDHPYTKEKRQAVLGFWECPFELIPVGKKELFDIEVEELNSYITGAGFVNKNCFDEAVQMLESVIRFHMGWIRSIDENQRKRAVLATNPPVNSIGDWIVPMFGPWLDITHQNPARPGELRWYAKDPDGHDFEVPDSRPYQFPGEDKPVLPMSRTFIPGKLSDNPYLMRTGYQAVLDNLDEPLRSAVRDGNFMAARKDQAYQVLPTDWVRAAQRRWKQEDGRDIPMTAIAADVGAGGIDRVVLSRRHGAWFDKLIVKPGKECPDGSAQAGLVAQYRRDGCGVVVDVGGGYGGDLVGRLRDNDVTAVRFNGSAGSTSRAKDGSGRIFLNKRAESWWRFREGLNPDQPGGSIIAIPDDPEVTAELTSVCYFPDILRIQLEDKKDVAARLGRSPDKGDAIVMAYAPGEVGAQRQRAQRSGGRDRPAQANVGYSSIKRTQ